MVSSLVGIKENALQNTVHMTLLLKKVIFGFKAAILCVFQIVM